MADPTPATKDTGPLSNALSGMSNSGLGGALTAGAVGLGLGLKQSSDYGAATAPLGAAAGSAGKAGQQYLGQALGGTLTPAQQQTYNTLQQQGQTLQQQAAPEIAFGQQGLQAYQAGQLPAWQQQQLDNQTAAAIAQARASMGANVDSSTMAQIEGQIRNQATIAKGELLQNNLAVTQSIFQAGITSEKEAFALYDAANTSVNQSLQQDFNNAMAALGLSSEAALAALKGKIAADSSVSDAVGGLLGSLAKATAVGAAQGSGGSFSDALNRIFGGGGGYTSSDIAAANAVGANLVGTSTSAPEDWLAANTDSGAVQDFGSYMGAMDTSAPDVSSFDFTAG